MHRKIGHVTLLVKDYDEAIEFYVQKAGFTVTADNDFGNGQRWVSVAPSERSETEIVFVLADTEEKLAKVGRQAADHVFLVLETDDCHRDYISMKEKGVKFLGEPRKVPWGTEVVFEDLYGNLLDLLQVELSQPTS